MKKFLQSEWQVQGRYVGPHRCRSPGKHSESQQRRRHRHTKRSHTWARRCDIGCSPADPPSSWTVWLRTRRTKRNYPHINQTTWYVSRSHSLLLTYTDTRRETTLTVQILGAVDVKFVFSPHIDRGVILGLQGRVDILEEENKRRVKPVPCMTGGDANELMLSTLRRPVIGLPKRKKNSSGWDGSVFDFCWDRMLPSDWCWFSLLFLLIYCDNVPAGFIQDN